MLSRVVVKWVCFDNFEESSREIKSLRTIRPYNVALINISLATYRTHNMLTLYMTSENMNLAFRLRCVGDEIYAGIYEWKWIVDVIKCAKYSENHWTPNALRVSTNVIHDVVPYDFIARGWAANQSSLPPAFVVIHRALWKCEQHKRVIQFFRRKVALWRRHCDDIIFFATKSF